MIVQSYSAPLPRFVFATEGMVVGMIAAAAVMVPLSETPLWPVGPPLLATGALYGIWRGARIRIDALPQGLRVRNLYRTYAVRWDDIERFVPCYPGALKGVECPGIEAVGYDRAIALTAMSSRHDGVVAAWAREHDIAR